MLWPGIIHINSDRTSGQTNGAGGAGCLRGVPDDVRFCGECQPVAVVDDGIRSQGNGYTPELDALRKGALWQSLRRRVIRTCPLCARCSLSISEIVDHIVPAQIAIQQARDSGAYPANSYAGYYIRSNLQGLCRPCHGTKTAEDKAHIGPWPDVVEAERQATKRRWSF